MSSRSSAVLLNVAAAVGALCLLVAVACVTTSSKPVVFRSGSMSPAITTGSLAFSRQVDASSLRVGDIVSVVNGAGSRVTHRITDIDWDRGGAVLTLRGDANADVDAEQYAVARADRVVFAVPYVGYFIGWLQDPAGLVLLGLVGLFLVKRVVWGDRPPPGRPRGGGGTRARRAATTGAVVVAAAVPTAASASSWTDAVAVQGTVLSTYQVPAPANFQCAALGLLSLSFSWDAVPRATSYTLHYGSSRLVTTSTSATVNGLSSGGTAWVEANRDFGQSTWISSPSATKRYSLLVSALGVTTAVCG